MRRGLASGSVCGGPVAWRFGTCLPRRRAGKRVPGAGDILVVRDPSSDHSRLGSTPKLNFSVKVTCAADTETTDHQF